MEEEARLEQTESGLAPTEPGWFVVNLGEGRWFRHEAFGAACSFESKAARFPDLGINVHVLAPGEPGCLYHGESNQEAYLVLWGECLLLVEGRERPLRQWDFVHLPAGTEHVAIGAGDGSCAILMVGARDPDRDIVYPVSELAARHGASAERETDSPAEAYARFGEPKPGRPDGWDALPWA